jgi:predicted RNA methylase
MIFGVYGRFLSIIIVNAPTMAIATMIATPAPITYISVLDVATGCCVGVAAASLTTNAVCELDGQYDCVPWKLAITL